MVARTGFSEKEKRAAIRAHQRSGLTANKFCRERGIAPSSFCTWRQNLTIPGDTDRPVKNTRKKQDPNVGVEFLPVTLLETKSLPLLTPGMTRPGSVVMEIVLPSGCLIRLATDCPSSFLDAALAVVQ